MTHAEAPVYVYGVLPASAGEAVRVSGVGESDVRVLCHGSLAALVSDLEGGELVAAREVRNHWRVLEQASADQTVLPIRFGTVMESEHAVRERLLEANAERLETLLGELAGRVQLSVKGVYDEERLLREVVNASPAVAALRERVRKLPDAAGYYDRIRLGELVASEVERRRQQDSRLVLDTLAPLAVSAHVEDVASADAAFNLAFLVERDRLEPFSAAVRELAEKLGDRVRMRYVGPLPPYSFAEADLTAGGEAWG